MTLAPLDDKAKDIAFSQGLLEEWTKTQPPQIADYMKTLVSGVDYWREKYTKIAEDYQQLYGNYTNLTVTYGQLLQEMQFLREQNTELLVEQQKEFHTPHANNLERRQLIIPSGTKPGDTLA